MEIFISKEAGYCFGVSRAMKLTNKIVEKHNHCYSLGSIIHNPPTMDLLKSMGLKVIESIDNQNLSCNDSIISRSHGTTKELTKELKRNYNFIDTTCPIVKNIQKKVETFYNNGYKVIIVGDKSHPEVISLNSYTNYSSIIINSIEEAQNMIKCDKICIVSQTTNELEHFKEIYNYIKSCDSYEDLIILNTICNATKLRQDACALLSKEMDAMIVLGGYNSSNTNKLANIARKYCDNVFHIEEVHELSLQNLIKFNKIGITAGASTPDWIIKEVTTIMENINNDEMMEAIESSMTKINRGDVVRGEVIYVTDTEVMVNINYKSDGIISKGELSNDPDANPKDLFKAGDSIDVYVVRMDDGEGNVILSTKRLEMIKGWQELEEFYNDKVVLSCKVLNIVKGGLTVLVNGLTGFMPASQISVQYIDDLNEYKGKELNARIIDLDRHKNRIILSARSVEKEELKKKQEVLWENLEKDSVVEGVVARLTDFGAFIDLGGIDGLAHISDLSWLRINHPSEVVRQGDKINVKVLDLDKEKNRISLGIKQITPKPWDVFIDSNKVGDIVTGKIVNVLDFGAFVRLKEDVDGLVHVSEISEEHIEKPSDKLKVGDVVEVKIMEINEDDKRISLSIKEA